MFERAQRKKAKLRLALAGPSGSGKTYSALLIAQGLGGKIALVDTERGSGSLYSHLCEYDVAELTAPFQPQKYVQAIQAAEQAGYEVLIIDSLSHAWAGEGGLLDIHDKATKSSRSGNSYMAWREVTPHHNRLVNTVLQTSLHIILTLRVKTAYEVQDAGNGKKAPVKIGLSPVFRDGIEYEATTVLDLSLEHIATASKDRTGIFDGTPFKPDVSTGKTLKEWLEAGSPEPQAQAKDPAPEFKQPEEQQSNEDTITQEQIDEIEQISSDLGLHSTEKIKRVNAWLGKQGHKPGVSTLDQLTSTQAAGLIKAMKQTLEKKVSTEPPPAKAQSAKAQMDEVPW